MHSLILATGRSRGHAMSVPLDADWTRVWVDVLQFLATGGVGVYVWLADRDRARTSALRAMEDETDKRLDLIVERLTRMEEQGSRINPAECGARVQRIASLEEAMRHSPNKGDLERTHARIDGLAEGLAELRGGIRRIESQLGMISQHLLDMHRNA